MDKIIAYLLERPILSAAISVLALADMANCIRLGHMDWPIPAIAAFSLAYLVQPTNA